MVMVMGCEGKKRGRGKFLSNVFSSQFVCVLCSYVRLVLTGSFSAERSKLDLHEKYINGVKKFFMSLV